MRLKRISSTTRILASGLLLLGGSSLALAGGYCRHCNPCPNGANGDFFGYYPTNWRPWPGIIVSPVQEPIPAPADSAKPLPSAPSMQQGPPPKPADKPADKPQEQTLFPSPGDPSTKTDQQPYFAPPQ
jgi:hypothetical protein